jgi:hypothetical protein
MSLAGSQLLQLVYKRFHSTFTIGLSRSSSLSSKDPDNVYESPLPLTNEMFGVAHGCVGSTRRKSEGGHSKVSGKRHHDPQIDDRSSGPASKSQKQSKPLPKQRHVTSVLNEIWYKNVSNLTTLLSLVEYTHFLKVSVEPFLSHSRLDEHPLEFLVPVIPLCVRKFMAAQFNAHEPPSFEAVRNCLSRLSLFKHTTCVLKKGSMGAASKVYLDDHPVHRLTIFNQLEPSEDVGDVGTIELRLSPSCRQKIPIVTSNIQVDPADTYKTICLPTVFDHTAEDESESLLYSYVSSRLTKLELSESDKEVLDAERRVAAALND